MEHKYLIESYETSLYECIADDVKEAVCAFAEYCGNTSDLFLKAMNGVTDPKDVIQMHNHFVSFGTINGIYEFIHHFTP